MIEARITKLSYKGIGVKYEVCFLFGLMDSFTHTELFSTLAEARAAFERAYVVETLRQARGNMAAAARQAGLDRSHYFRLVRRHGIEPKQYGSPVPHGR